MKRHSYRVLTAAFVAAIAASMLAHVASAGPAEPSVPERIAVEEGNKVFLIAHAVGVQIYKCNDTAAGYRWSLLAPRADLHDDDGKLLMTHFAGPSWQARDGSIVKAGLVDRVNVDPTAIDWFLLRVTSRAAGEDGDRLFATSFIQRINTTGGLAPAAETCNAASVGEVVEIPYTADYVFWKPTAS